MPERALRIVHVIARLNVGGASVQVLQLAAEQQRRGDRVTVVAGTLQPGEAAMDYLADELGVQVRHMPSLQRELSPRRDLASIRQLVRLLRSERPDVLHTHTAKAGATGRIAARLACAARPAVVVHTFHGHVLSGYFSPRRERIYRLLERALARGATRLIAVSDEVRDELVALGIAPSSRFVVIPYGFPIDDTATADTRHECAVARGELGVSETTFVVGWVGRLTAIKRPLDLVRVLQVLSASGIDARLVLVGDGPERAAVERLAKQLEVADRCTILGFRQDLSRWYAAFDALCLTSGNEGTPVVAIEALLAGTPVVATRAGGTATVVDDGETGFLSEVGDVDGLAAHLRELADQPELRRELGSRGVARMHERFGLERMVDEIETLYRTLLAS